MSLKLKAAEHDVAVVRTLAALHLKLRQSDPDFIIVDSKTFPEPATDYRTMLKTCRRRFLLYYDTELMEYAPGMQTYPLSDSQRTCLTAITQALTDIKILSMIEKTHLNETREERQFLKRNRLRRPLAQLLGCLLKNRGTDIPAATLISLLWQDTSASHQQTLYAYINQLRSLLEKRNMPLVIEKRLKGTYRISIKKAAP